MIYELNSSHGSLVKGFSPTKGKCHVTFDGKYLMVTGIEGPVTSEMVPIEKVNKFIEHTVTTTIIETTREVAC